MTSALANPPGMARNTVLVLDGYGIDLRVDHGALVLRGGIADRRTEHRLHRSDRTVQRILISGSTGSVSLAALRWCTDIGIAVICLDPTTGEILLVNAPRVHDDARLRRAQAKADVGSVGVDLARDLITAKLHGQADTIRRAFGDLDTVEAIDTYRDQLTECDTLDGIRYVEANAAATYFRAWRGIGIRWAKGDRSKVSPAWLTYIGRTSALNDGHSARKAVDPINALANYCYRLLEVEAVLACQALGLDPGLGVLHADKKGRNSLALDLIEPVRPEVDAHILNLVRTQVFTSHDFVETRDGQVRVLAPLTQVLAESMPRWADLLAPHAEALAHAFAEAGSGQPLRRTPLSGRAKSSPRRRKTPVPMPAPSPRCEDCGTVVAQRRQKRCAACNELHVTTLAHGRAGRARERLTQLRQEGNDPSQTDAARAKRSASIALNRAALAAWEAEHPDAITDPDHYWTEIYPKLSTVSIPTIAKSLNVSVSSASKIRSGSLLPHARHWDSLWQLGTSPRSDDSQGSSY
ncbi:MAG: CRISPR-associated endonuclease Cas1 [Gammaproteobacteria bacterium]